MALVPFQQFYAANPDDTQQQPAVTLWAKGISDSHFYPVQIDPATGLLQVVSSSSPLNSNGSVGAVTVGTSAVQANVSGSNLTNRTLLTVFNNSANTVYYGYTSGVTTTSGSPILANQTATWNIGSALTVYLIAGSAGNNVRVSEAL